jgi:hypothetical protein
MHQQDGQYDDESRNVYPSKIGTKLIKSLRMR